MRPSAEELAAFADGELTGETLTRVAAAVEGDPELAAEVAAHRSLKARLANHFAPIAAEPVPDRLKAIVARGGADATIIDFAAAADRRKAPSALRPRNWTRWATVTGAMAAALLLAVVLQNPFGQPSGYADEAVRLALDTQISGQPAGETPVRVVMSFRNSRGEFCRGFAGADQSGIACRDQTGWRLERQFPGLQTQTTAYRQAGSASEELMTAMQDLAAGPALDADAEAAARARDWRR